MKHLVFGIIKFITALVLVVSIASCGGKEERKIKYLEKGKAYLEEKNYEKAKVEFKNVLQIDPKFADVYYYLGQLEEEKKDLAKAVASYRKVIELDPLNTKTKIRLAKIYIIAGTDNLIKDARKLLNEAKTEDPENVKAELVRATLEYQTGSREKATIRIEKVIEKDTGLVDGALLLSGIYMSKKEFSKAEALLLKFIKNNPNELSLKLRAAELYANTLKDYSSAEKYLQEAVNIEPENYSLQIAMASFYARQDKVDKAEAILRDAISKKDEEIERYVVLFELLSRRVSVKKVEEEIKLAISKKPDFYDLKFVQVRFLTKINKREEAKSVLKEIVVNKEYELEGIKARTILARLLLEEGDKAGASKYVAEVITEHPNDNDALLIAGKIALIDSDAVTAINGLRTVVKNDPKNAEASMLLAQAHELNNEPSLAENELKKAIEANPVNDKVHVNYAKYLASKGRMNDAYSVADKALAYFKKSYELMVMKLKISAALGKESEVEDLMDMMGKLNANNAEVNIYKGRYYLAKHETEKAIEQFEKAYAKSQDKYESLKLIVNAYAVSNQLDKALIRLQKILDKNDQDAVANLLTGQIYLAQKKPKDAEVKFKIASNSAESWFPPYDNLAILYLSEKNIDKALAVYQQAVTKTKSKMHAQLKMAGIYERAKNYTSAMKVYQDVLSNYPSNKLAANNYASLLLDHGTASDIPRALELAKKFENLQKPALLDTLAWAYAKSGDNTKAVEILKPIVEKAPKIAVFRYHLGYALFQIGDKAAAKSHLKIAYTSKQEFAGKDDAGKLLNSI